MTPALEGTQPAADSFDAKRFAYKVTARPKHAKPFTFYVIQRLNHRGRPVFLVCASPDSSGWFSRHTAFHTAVRSANYRARRYNRAYSKPRNVLPAKAVAA